MLKQQIQLNTIEALKKGDKRTAEVLRLILSALLLKEKERRYAIVKEKPALREEELVQKSALTDEQVIDVVVSEIKKRKDAIYWYQKGGRQELADKEKKEIEVLQKYLPPQLSGDELKKLIEKSIAKVGAAEIKDMGKVMADLMPRVKGAADASEISRIVKESLK